MEAVRYYSGVAAAFLVAGMLLSHEASASCSTSGSTTTCDGNSNVYPFFDSPPGGTGGFTYVFQQLTTTATNGAGTFTIDIEGGGGNSQAASPLTVTFDGGQFGLSSTIAAVYLAGTGGAGNDGKNHGSDSDLGDKTGGNGDAGGAGGTLTVHWESGDVSAAGEGLQIHSNGGAGGSGGKGATGSGTGKGGDGGAGGNGGGMNVIIGGGGPVGISTGFNQGIYVYSQGGAGGNGGTGKSTAGEGDGSHGGAGGDTGTLTFQAVNAVSITTAAGSQLGDAIAVLAHGGDGGQGGTGTGTFSSSSAGNGGVGGTSGNVLVETTGAGIVTLITYDGTSDGVDAESLAGNGGNGGDGDADVGKAKGGDGNPGGTAGTVTVNLVTTTAASIGLAATETFGIVTYGDQSQGIFARSYGGAGGNGGKGSGGLGDGKGGAAAGPGPGNTVTVTLAGMITTYGDESNGILAQSVGGFAGDAGEGSGFVAFGAGSESGGQGGTVAVTINAGTTISTAGDYASGIVAQSVGGGGGTGSSASGVVALGGTGDAGGDGGAVNVASSGGAISTGGDSAFAIMAQSTGGSGGSAGASKGVTSLGGKGGSGGTGGDVAVTNMANLTTVGDQADALFVQSVGGGGGNAHSTAGITAFGASGGVGGTGGTITVTLGATAVISTQGDDADAIFLQSVGGGGGSGSNALAAGGEFSMAYGGKGGSGSDGGDVTFTNGGVANAKLANAKGADFADIDYTIVTQGDRARGIVAESIGGSGGDGGNAISASAGLAVDVSLGASGGGTQAGDGGTVMVTVGANIMTSGDNAGGIFAQSHGGGGGSAGNTITSANGQSVNVGIAIGGTGGSGGAGGAVSVLANGAVTTGGASSADIVAQSVGGGGGHSGTTIAGNAISTFSATVALGGAGGAGGTGADVHVEAHAPLVTVGAASEAVFAQSIGGSGGAAHAVVAATGASGTGSADIGIGNKGGSGGAGGEVGVSIFSTINTSGANANAITAQSIGGGGGNGSVTIAASLQDASDTNVAVGGEGGGSGAGGAVNVLTGDQITTLGDNSAGVLAQSISNGGGNGGFTLTGSGTSAGNVGVTVAGSGGNAGASGDVAVTIAGGITTSGDQATAIIAQSLAGGGGRAVGGVTGTVASMGEVGVTLGGSGGAGGAAGTVDVTIMNTAIVTGGDWADGVLSQSTGGNGGHGGFAMEGSLTGGDYSGSANVTLGGAGGSGGTGGAVTVTLDAGLLQTGGYTARGVVAQSVGGSGGNGGSVYSGNITMSSQVSVDVAVDIGGGGGKGGVGGAVSVTNYSAIQTGGFYSDAILAQSVGGDGGNGGGSYNVVAQVNGQTSAKYAVTLGGAGGSGNDGGAVSVSNFNNLTTTLSASPGIYAQSVGGGGGRGGNAATMLFDISGSAPPNGTTIDVNVAFTMGGTGGAGGDGGPVNVQNFGTINTSGVNSWGIYAQSVGGGGGDGGSASGTVISVAGSGCTFTIAGWGCSGKDANGNKVKSTYTPTLNIVAGGAGGGGGDGGDVTVNNGHDVTTHADTTYAIFAQSIGGGGGNGGYGALGTQAFTNDATAKEFLAYISKLSENSNLTSWQNVEIAIGGSGGAAGNGGKVEVTVNAVVETYGAYSHAIYAQSIGGGGGNGGAAMGGFGSWETVLVGGRGSGGGDGGEIDVTIGGTVRTYADDSMGVLAHTVGGGGGSAGDIERTIVHAWTELNIGEGVGIQLNAGNGGNGGAITINVNGPIETQGAASHGIYAQSVGGSGGAAHLEGTNVSLDWAGSAGDAGSGGDILINTTAPISVSGDGAHAIFAQSVSGTKSDSDHTSVGGTITVNIGADITASGGNNARGLLLQSEGFEANGTIAVTVESGVTVSTGAASDVAIGYMDGTGNTLTNYGTIIRPDSAATAVGKALADETPSGYVVRAEGGDLAIVNHGTLSGSILLYSGVVNSLDNYGILGLGTVVQLNKSSSLVNQSGGIMSAAGVGAIGTSTVTAKVSQVAGATLGVDIEFGTTPPGTTTADLIQFAGPSAQFAGAVQPNVIGTSLPTSGTTGEVTILEATGGTLADSGMVPVNSSTVTYTLASASANGHPAINLGYEVDYTPWNGSPGAQAKVSNKVRRTITSNHTHFGHYIDQLILARIDDLKSGANKLGFIDDLTRYLLNTRDVADLVDVYDRFAPGALFTPADAALFSSFDFADTLNSCPDPTASGTGVFTRNGSCVWARIGGAATRATTDALSKGYSENTFTASGGIQSEIADQLFAGFAFDYEAADLSNDTLTGNGYRVQGGAVVKKEFGNSTLSGSISGGFSDYDLNHTVLTPGGAEIAKGSPRTTWLAAHARFAHIFDLSDTTYVKPWLDVGITQQWQDAFKMKTGDAYGLDLASTNATFVTLNPMIEFGGVFDTMGMTSHAKLRAGALAIVSGRGWSTDGQFIGLGGRGPTFQFRDDVNSLFAQIGASVETRVNENVSVEIGLDGLFAAHQQAYGANARLNVNF